MSAAKWPSLQSVLMVIYLCCHVAQSTKSDWPCSVPLSELEYFDIRLPLVQLPADVQTVYLCQEFQIPEHLLKEGERVQAVAFSPLIGNEGVLHHMLVFGCDSSTEIPMMPHRCGGGQCKSYLNVWSVGFPQHSCLHQGTGITLGKGGFTKLSLQIHLNNGNLTPNVTDDSGMRVYYTRTPQTHELGNVQIGQHDLEIPAHVTQHSHSGGCSTQCTGSLLTQPVYLTKAFLHMHQLGTSARLELYRHGKLVTVVTENPAYLYSQPVSESLDKPIAVLPGDELRMTCWFDSTNGVHQRNHTVYFGEGVDGEMCFAFVSYFPKTRGFDQCTQFDQYDLCESYNTGRMTMGSCVPGVFYANQNRNLMHLEKECDTAAGGPLSSSCQSKLNSLSAEPCMSGRPAVYIRREFLRGVNWDHIDKLLKLRS